MHYNRSMVPQGDVTGDDMQPVTEFDEQTNATRGLFEKIAHLAILWAAAAVPGSLLLLALRLAPDLLSRKATFLTFLAVTLASGVAMSYLRDAATRRGQEDFSEVLAKRYAFPMTLVAGILVGAMWQQYDTKYSERGRAAEAAMADCMRLPQCYRMADPSLR